MFKDTGKPARPRITMIAKTLKGWGGILAFIHLAWTAQSQTNSNGLEVSARASLFTGTNYPQVFLTMKLVNTTHHEVTVLTKNLNVAIEPTTDHLVISLGYCN